jgi:23S rRNA (cytosine1962-C5)-methyltransferase
MVGWAKENAAASGLSDKPVRWLVDDCLKFMAREKRRGVKYDGIIMDPPSYGRGPNGEMWKLETGINELLLAASDILSDDAEFFVLNTYTAGFSPTILTYLVKEKVAKKNKENTFSDEIGLKMTARDFSLPCGNTTIWTKEKIK